MIENLLGFGDEKLELNWDQMITSYDYLEKKPIQLMDFNVPKEQTVKVKF